MCVGQTGVWLHLEESDQEIRERVNSRPLLGYNWDNNLHVYYKTTLSYCLNRVEVT